MVFEGVVAGDEADEGGGIVAGELLANGAACFGVGMEKIGVDTVGDGEDFFGSKTVLGVELSGMLRAEDDARGQRSGERCAGGDGRQRRSLGEAAHVLGVVDSPDDGGAAAGEARG